MDKVDLLLPPTKGVPMASEPLWWDRRIGVAANLNTIGSYMHKYEAMLPDGCWFDEAAIMVPTKESRRMLASELMFNGWQMFNSAADLVYASPFGTRYVVEYQFFKHPRYTWRLEVMLLGQGAHIDGQPGFSPLHQALWYPNGQTPSWSEHSELPIPHLSFKPPTDMVEAMGAGKAVRQVVDGLRENSFILSQACQSTYGQFWYLLHVEAARQLYVKPRINTRDGAS